MGEKMTLHDRVEFALRDAGFDFDEASRIAHLATPAQTVDVEAVRKVVATLDCVGSAGSDHYSSEYLQYAINDASDKLSQAIGDKT